MTSQPAPCPSCAAPLVEIRLSADLGMQSCSACKQRWWRHGDAPAVLGDVLVAVGALSGRRRAD